MDDKISVSGEELWTMIRLSNFLLHPNNMIQYKSLDHIGKLYENAQRPSRSLQSLLSKMMKLRFLRINENDLIEFDSDAFDDFVKNNDLGREMWAYFDARATYIEISPK